MTEEFKIEPTTQAIIDRLRETNEALRGLVRICKAVRYTAGLGKDQMKRVEDAEALLSKNDGKPRS